MGITYSSSCALSDYPNSSEVKNETSQSSAAGIRDDCGNPRDIRCGIGTPARRQVLRNETETARLGSVFTWSAEHDPLGVRRFQKASSRKQFRRTTVSHTLARWTI